MAGSSFRSRYRVDGVPLRWKIPFWAYGYGAGASLFAQMEIVRRTSRITLHRAPPPGSYVYCTWHENTVLSFFVVAIRGEPQVWINHPAWYMKPVHVVGKLSGIERMALGSGGHGGRAAASEVVACLRRGYSTLMFPDGPYGPLHRLNRGVLHMAAESGRPIVAVRFACDRAIHLGGWDRKVVPLPFGGIDVHFSAPLAVADIDAAAPRLAEAMSAS